MFSPAPGVIQTNPVIIPWIAPITEGFLKYITSKHVHAKRLAAVQMWVLITAMEESTLAAKGSPPLKPVHPPQRIPAPVSASNRLLGGNSSLSSFDLGPTYREDQASQCYFLLWVVDTEVIHFIYKWFPSHFKWRIHFIIVKRVDIENTFHFIRIEESLFHG